MKTRKCRTAKPRTVQPRALPRSPGDDAQQPTQDTVKRSIRLPNDPAAQRRAVKDTYINVMGASVFGAQTHAYVQDGSGKAAEMFMAAVLESVEPRDAIEEMLIVQMAWLHARMAAARRSDSAR